MSADRKMAAPSSDLNDSSSENFPNTFVAPNSIR
jgi:hypothetical protein